MQAPSMGWATARDFEHVSSSHHYSPAIQQSAVPSTYRNPRSSLLFICFNRMQESSCPSF